MDFTVDLKRQTVRFNFRERKHFLCMSIARCMIVVSVSKTYVDLTAQFFSAISADVSILFCEGATARFSRLCIEVRFGRRV